MAIQPSKIVIGAVSDSLKKLLADNISILDEGNISYESPGEFTPPSAIRRKQADAVVYL